MPCFDAVLRACRQSTLAKNRVKVASLLKESQRNACLTSSVTNRTFCFQTVIGALSKSGLRRSLPAIRRVSISVSAADGSGNRNMGSSEVEKAKEAAAKGYVNKIL